MKKSTLMLALIAAIMFVACSTNSGSPAVESTDSTACCTDTTVVADSTAQDTIVK